MDRKQKFYEKTKDLYIKASGDGTFPILTESSLRLELPIRANVTKYDFECLFGINSKLWVVQPNEVRLQQNDNFHIDRTGFYVALTTAVTDYNFRLKTYPNEVEFTAATANDMVAIYNGGLNINVNKRDLVINHRLSKHWKVPQTQRLSVAANTNRDELQLADDGMIEMAPSLMLGGKKTNLINITLNGAVTNATAADNSRMILIFDGLLAQNAAIEFEKKL